MKTAAQRVAFVAGLIGMLQRPVAGESLSQGCAGADPSTRSAPAHSRSCLVCHDGSVASDVIAGRASLREFGREGNHPVMVSHERAYARAPAEFVAPQMLDRNVKLVNGEVHCVSCHAPSTTGQWVLAKPNHRSALCLSCHRK